MSNNCQSKINKIDNQLCVLKTDNVPLIVK